MWWQIRRQAQVSGEVQVRMAREHLVNTSRISKHKCAIIIIKGSMRSFWYSITPCNNGWPEGIRKPEYHVFNLVCIDFEVNREETKKLRTNTPQRPPPKWPGHQRSGLGTGTGKSQLISQKRAVFKTQKLFLHMYIFILLQRHNLIHLRLKAIKF